MSKECKHEEWNPCGNDFYSCRKCGILRTSQQVNLYAEKDRQIADLEAKLAEKDELIENYKMGYTGKIWKQQNNEISILKSIVKDQDKEIAELKQQLADTEEQNKRVLEKLELIVSANQELEQKLAEKEEQLKNAIVPKFKVGQKVYKVYTPNQKYPFEFKIIGFKITKSKGEDNIFYNVEEDGFDMGWYPDEILFATKEEAQAKLKELQGE